MSFRNPGKRALGWSGPTIFFQAFRFSSAHHPPPASFAKASGDHGPLPLIVFAIDNHPIPRMIQFMRPCGIGEESTKPATLPLSLQDGQASGACRIELAWRYREKSPGSRFLAVFPIDIEQDCHGRSIRLIGPCRGARHLQP